MVGKTKKDSNFDVHSVFDLQTAVEISGCDEGLSSMQKRSTLQKCFMFPHAVPLKPL